MKLKVKSDIQPIINQWKTEVLAKLDAQYKVNGKYISKDGNVIVSPTTYITAVTGYFSNLTSTLDNYLNNTDLKSVMMSTKNYKLLKTDARRTAIEYVNGSLLGIIPDSRLPTGFKDFTAFMYNFSDFYNTTSTQIFNSITYTTRTENTTNNNGSTTSTTYRDISGCTIITNLINKLNSYRSSEVSTFKNIIHHIVYECADIYADAMDDGVLGQPIHIPDDIDVSMNLVQRNIREFEVRGISYPEVIKNNGLYDPTKPKEYLYIPTADDFVVPTLDIDPIIPQENESNIPPSISTDKVLIPSRKAIKRISDGKIILADGLEIKVIREELGNKIINTIADNVGAELYEGVLYRVDTLTPEEDGYYRVLESEISNYTLTEINKVEILEQMTL